MKLSYIVTKKYIILKQINKYFNYLYIIYKLTIYNFKFRHKKYFYKYILFRKKKKFILNIYLAYINLVLKSFKLDLKNSKIQTTLQSRNIIFIYFV